MKAPISWLKEYVDIGIPVAELAHKLTMAGAEVGAVESTGGWNNVFVGLVLSVEQHPNAEKLHLVTVDVQTEKITVVCGAPNVACGQRIAFARMGAELIDPDTGKKSKLKKAKIRGVESQGMVCSECELGISQSHEGILVLPNDAPIGTPLDSYLGDAILDVETTANRPDLLSVIGIAREVAAITSKPMKLPNLDYKESETPIGSKASVEIADADLCPRYTASLVTGIKVGPSPAWMQQRLTACGQRPINNVVDVTNYVMLEFGQPLHAFDFDKLAKGKIIVRRAKDGDVMATLDDVKRELTKDTLMINDGAGPVAVAGVMGGANSEVSDRTVNVLLESANFNPASIRRTSARFKLRSEASLRFEKGLSAELPVHALRRATQLLAQLGGGQIAKGIIDVYPGKQPERKIDLKLTRVERVLGVKIPQADVKRVLTSLGFKCDEVKSDELSVTVPYWRTEVKLAEDVIEEIARIIGYDNLPTTQLSGALPHHTPDPMRTLRRNVADILAGCGMQEIITYSLTSLESLKRFDREAKPLRLENPITPEQEYMRTSLRPGLLSTLAANLKHEDGGIRLFEAGRVYLPKKNDLPHELEMLAGIMCGPRTIRSWHGEGKSMDFFDAKGIIETLMERLGIDAGYTASNDKTLVPARQASIVVGKESIGILGELHPRLAEQYDIDPQTICLFEIDMEKLLAATSKEKKFRALPRFPAVLRDIAIILDVETPAQKVIDIIGKSPLAARVTLFDVYTGKQVPQGKKSLALSISYQSPDRTLTDEEVDKAQGKILERLTKELGATLRG
ncbi:MAG: phenylalanine--tRNA ligase subunit beta [Dehalococcoidia bacterium]|jgi:phenylalanyl-tRNA synthetase beta chain